MSGLRQLIPHVKQLSPETVVVMINAVACTVESAIGAPPSRRASTNLMKPFDLRLVEAVVKRAPRTLRSRRR